MSRITIDADLKTKLGGLTEQVELRDADGNIVAHVLPEEEYVRLLYKLAKTLAPATEEENRRRQAARKGPGKSLAEILKRLEGT